MSDLQFHPKGSVESCGYIFVHEDRVAEVLRLLPGADTLQRLAELFKVFGDSTRIKILYDLFGGEKNVTEICADLEMNQSAVSHQLKLLKTARLINSRREGKQMIYFLADDHVKTIIAMGKEHIEE